MTSTRKQLRRKLFKRGWRIRLNIRLALLLADPHCHYCGFELNRFNSTLDHVVPRSKGGTDAPENLLLSCRRCNVRKADAPLSEITCHIQRGWGIIPRSRKPA
jgi:5-methylcytosine-specific restriction endonuclease McrA